MEHKKATSLRCKVESKMCSHVYPPIVWGFYGKGFRGYGQYYPSIDIRGCKLGSSARKLLLSLPFVETPPLLREESRGWLTIDSQAEKKVAKRLYLSGLLWSCDFYESRGDAKAWRKVALTPLGGKVLDVFGDDIRHGRRIRWQKWSEPSVASSPEKWEQFLSSFDDLADAPEKTIEPRKPLKLYGNSMDYLVARIARDEIIWNSGAGSGFGFSFDYSLPYFVGFSEVA